MFKLLREFSVLFQIISFVFCHQTITVHAISSPLFPTRKSSSQRELHSPKISGIFSHFSSSFCLVVSCSSLKKILLQQNLSRNVAVEKRNPVSAHWKKCSLRQAEAQQVLISARHMPQLTLQCTLDVNALVIQFGKHQIKL